MFWARAGETSQPAHVQAIRQLKRSFMGETPQGAVPRRDAAQSNHQRVQKIKKTGHQG